MNKEERVIKLIEDLESTFEIRTFLDHDPYKVLIRTILSQRTRDENTDQATNNLFANSNISDINFESRECIVFGKGDKERKVYFDAKAKIHLQDYLNSRKDNNPALFVTLDAPFDRLKISGVEIRIRNLGRHLNMGKIHPHKFRRTMATRAIDKGMPIEQVQKLLGHSQIDTTLQYAIVNQANVKTSHQKFIA